MTDLDKLAKSLTKAQRALLLGLLTHPMKHAAYAQVRGHLIRKGLWADVGFTPLGLALRNHLKGQNDGQ